MQRIDLQPLLDLLTLQQTDTDRYRGHGPDGRRGRMYGGEVLAQALRAAQRASDAAASTDGPRQVNALHGYFLQPGDPGRPVDYAVSTLRVGRSFALRRVIATQADSAIASLDISFHIAESGPLHDAPLPTVPAPETLPSENERLAAARAREPERFRRLQLHSPQPLEERFVEDLFLPPPRPPRINVWIRARDTVSDPALAAAIAVYYSDDPLMDNALLPHTSRFETKGFTRTSLDHAMWFHRPFDVNAWHLFAQDSPVASGARAFTRGTFHDRSGRVVASVAQEILLRPR